MNLFILKNNLQRKWKLLSSSPILVNDPFQHSHEQSCHICLILPCLMWDPSSETNNETKYITLANETNNVGYISSRLKAQPSQMCGIFKFQIWNQMLPLLGKSYNKWHKDSSNIMNKRLQRTKNTFSPR